MFFAAKCIAGKFSPNGLESPGTPCQPCPIGTYNDVNGSKECEACPQGSTTLAAGANSVSQCFSKYLKQ